MISICHISKNKEKETGLSVFTFLLVACLSVACLSIYLYTTAMSTGLLPTEIYLSTFAVTNGHAPHLSTISSVVTISRERLQELEYIEKNYVKLVTEAAKKILENRN
jgi:hypothetical protein